MSNAQQRVPQGPSQLVQKGELDATLPVRVVPELEASPL